MYSGNPPMEVFLRQPNMRAVTVFQTAADERSGITVYDDWYHVQPGVVNRFDDLRDVATIEERNFFHESGEKHPAVTAREENAKLHALAIGQDALPILKRAY